MIDDHELLRDALQAYFQSLGYFSVELANDVRSGMDIIGRTGPFDLVLLDYHIPGMNGLDGLRLLIAANSPNPVALISGVVTPRIADAALRQGAIGILRKTMSMSEILPAISQMIGGNCFLEENLKAEMLAWNKEPTIRLTSREEEVLRCICEGQSNKMIARELILRESTVKMFVKLLYAKLDVHSRTQAIKVANSRCLLE